MADILKEVSLEQMLEAREKRTERQKELIGMYCLPLISFTVNMPGKFKKTYASKVIFTEGFNELLKKLIESRIFPIYKETCNNITGYQAYIVVDMNVCKLKELAMEIEYQHPLGRFFDLDVIGCDGLAVSREMLNYSSRKCFICGKDAPVCARSRAHSVDELLERINYAVDSYVKKNSVLDCLMNKYQHYTGRVIACSPQKFAKL